MSRFIQIHTLASYPGVLLNRDDAGLAKRLPYGGASRIRISSQCLKRHWRRAEDEWSLKSIEAPMGWRSRETVERLIRPKLTGPAEVLDGICAALVRHLYGKNSAAVKDRQAILLGEPEIAYLSRLADEAAAEAADAKTAEAAIDARIGKGDGKRNLAALLATAGSVAAGLEAALFGRMMTSDTKANTDAAIHVAHAFTVHREESESDYFTVVDDLREQAGEAGSGGIFDTELTSGLFYSYVVVDVPLLVANLGGDRDLAARVVENLIHLIATVSPGAKKGSTAPYAYADLLLVEIGRRQPRSLSGAFRKPVPLNTPDGVLNVAQEALSEHLTRLDAAYDGNEVRHLLSVSDAPLPRVDRPESLTVVASAAAATVRAEAA